MAGHAGKTGEALASVVSEVWSVGGPVSGRRRYTYPNSLGLGEASAPSTRRKRMQAG